jgi:hypothetical protein
MKPCIKCGSTDRKLNGDCRPCSKERDRILYQKNKELRKQQSKEYYYENLTACRELHKQWRVKNAEAKRQADAAYKAKNPEKIAAYKSKHYKNNVEKIKLRSKLWVQANRDYVKSKQRQYHLDNPEVSVNAKAKRRLRIGDERLPYGTIPAKYKEQNGLCACCGEPLVKYHVDHIMPLALGGRNIPINIQLLLPRCNQRKSAKHPDVWKAEIGVQPLVPIDAC